MTTHRLPLFLLVLSVLGCQAQVDGAPSRTDAPATRQSTEAVEVASPPVEGAPLAVDAAVAIPQDPSGRSQPVAWDFTCPSDPGDVDSARADCAQRLQACVRSSERAAANPRLAIQAARALAGHGAGHWDAVDAPQQALSASVVEEVFASESEPGVSKALGFATVSGDLYGAYTCSTETAPKSAIFCPNASDDQKALCALAPGCEAMTLGDTFINLVSEELHGDLYFRLHDGVHVGGEGTPELGPRVLDFTLVPGSNPFEAAQRSWYQRAVEAGGEGAWVPLYINKGSCEPIVAYSAPFMDEAGRLAGVSYALSYVKDEPCYQQLVSSCGECAVLGDSANYPAEAAAGTGCTHL